MIDGIYSIREKIIFDLKIASIIIWWNDAIKQTSIYCSCSDCNVSNSTNIMYSCVYSVSFQYNLTSYIVHCFWRSVNLYNFANFYFLFIFILYSSAICSVSFLIIRLYYYISCFKGRNNTNNITTDSDSEDISYEGLFTKECA